jgi:uncharacterized UPF0146 family protein
MIIGLCGAQGSGKDTVANILVANYGFVRISFAAALKDVIAILFSWPRHMLEGDTPESRTWREAPDAVWSQKTGIPGFSPRKALQTIGTDLIRDHIYINLWIDIVEKRIAMILSANPEAKIVVTDCRFTNEVAAVKKFSGARLIRIVRPDCEHMSDIVDLSESVDITLVNNSTIEALEGMIDTVIDH